MKEWRTSLSKLENDDELQQTRPFFWVLTIVMVMLYGSALYTTPAVRVLPRLIIFTLLFGLHGGLHWLSPLFATTPRRMAVYLPLQVALAALLSLLSQTTAVALGLYLALVGETVGILEDWRRSLVAIAIYLLLIAITLGLMENWRASLTWIGMLIPMLIFVFVYVTLFVRQSQARSEAQHLLQELAAAHQQLAAYAQQVETLTLTNERQRMARELHDTLAQGLAGLVLQLEALEVNLERGNVPQAAHIAGQAKTRARSTLADARRAIDDLRITGTQSPLEAIAREVERFTSATGIPCATELPTALDLPSLQSEHLLRCISEGLTNVARHAQATQAWVTLTQADAALHITVRDNGRGFDPTAIPAGHYGLVGLRERARLAGGTLHIASEPEQGTRIEMVIPL
ncbi:MAG: sensor histidine kinase [Anaerolineales bacterium]|nr:sensor histidine kinase [Anaerolineales bacterium]MCB8965866.1 sensor histidine kinase [Ardenticatenaceae bacterium]